MTTALNSMLEQSGKRDVSADLVSPAAVKVEFSY